MAYCGAIGSINVLEFVSTDLFDESQENPFLLQQHSGYGAYTSPPATLRASPASSPSPSPLRKHASVRFAELPLDDASDPSARILPLSASPTKMAPTWSSQGSPTTKRQSAVVVPTPVVYHTTPPPPPMAFHPYDTAPPVSPPTSRPSITITLPLGLGYPRQTSSDSDASVLAEEAELHKLLYSLTQLGLGQQQHQQPQSQPQPTSPHPQQAAYAAARASFQQPPVHDLQQSFHDSYASTVSTPTSPSGVSTSSLWLPSTSSQEARASTSSQPTGTASLMFRPLPSRQSRRMTARQSKAARCFSSAPNSPVRDNAPDGCFQPEEAMDDHAIYGDDAYGSYGGSQPTSPQRSRGSVTFLTVKNLLRGGGALARTTRREQPNRRPTCMGSELTISSRLKRREKFQRPTVITDAYHRVSVMKLGTSPLKAKIKHKAFPETHKIDGHDCDDHQEADTGMPSPRGQLRRESLITLETLDKIGTRHACPVQLLDEPLPDFTNVQPRVDAWNHYKKPKQKLRRPSAWLLGATATSTPYEAQD